MARILWAEDGLDDQYLIKHALGQLSDTPTVDFVEDGVMALDVVSGRRPDLVVLDINMPVMDGLETLRRLRANEATRLLPVVVFSTGREENAVQVSRQLGVLEYIQKPFHYQDFTTAVGRIVAMAKTSRPEGPLKPKKA